MIEDVGASHEVGADQRDLFIVVKKGLMLYLLYALLMCTAKSNT